jgi:predicted nucleotidyltransferase
MNKKKYLSQKEKDILIGRIFSVLQQNEYILFAYIYGSFASNKEFNDIDVGIFISDENMKSPLQMELDLEGELEDKIKTPVDVRIINHAPLSFIYNVLKSGFVAVDKDISFRSDFEGLIFKKYFDFQYLRREYLREIVNAPV